MAVMPSTIELLGKEPMTYEEAKSEETNILNLATYKKGALDFYQSLWNQRTAIKSIIHHHLALGKYETCKLQLPKTWIRGGFNLCVLAEVRSKGVSKTVIFRCPLPYKNAEKRYPGSIDEKLNCEIGATIWVQEKCPEIRIPHLYGFGFSDGRQFTHETHMSFFARICRRFWRAVYNFCGLPLLSQYILDMPSHHIDSAYLVLEYFGPEVGDTLFKTFDAKKEDTSLRRNLFKGLSRTMLSLARIPHARIGSFQFHTNGNITLSNRPLNCMMMIAENDGAPQTIQRGQSFPCTDAYASDMITYHDQRFLQQPNAAFDEGDCHAQMSVKTLLRVLSHRHIQPDLRYGPFLLQFTDLHASNIFVDDEWNITGLIDMEWVCALPAEMLDVPYWLTGCSIDGIEDAELDKFSQVRDEFMSIFQQEEEVRLSENTELKPKISEIMNTVWETKGVWFWHCLSSINAMYFILESHLLPPKSLSVEAEKQLSKFWCWDSQAVIQRKIADKKVYDDELRKMFDEEAAPTCILRPHGNHFK